jgi:hypothetical protein
VGAKNFWVGLVVGRRIRSPYIRFNALQLIQMQAMCKPGELVYFLESELIPGCIVARLCSLWRRGEAWWQGNFPTLVFEHRAFLNLFNELDSCVSQISHLVPVQLLISASVLLLLLFNELDSFVTQSFTLVL